MSQKGNEFLGKVIVARYADGGFSFVGRCFSYCDAPTVGVKLPNGSEAHWRADMCEVLEMPDEAVELLIPACTRPQQIQEDEKVKVGD